MNRSSTRRTIIAIVASALILPAVAQYGGIRMQDIAGTWMLTAAVATAPDGQKSDTFGASPRGQAIFAPDGRFSVVFTGSGLPKFASGQRMKGTPEENQAIVQGTLAYYGTYTIDKDNVLVTTIDSSTFPAWNGQVQKRKLTLDGDNLQWMGIVGTQGGTVQVSLKRAK